MKVPLVRLPTVPRRELTSTWRDAKPRRIEASLTRALTKDPGGWYVAAARTELSRKRSVVRTIAGREVTLWRTADGVVAGPGACPHLGARLHDCPVIDGAVVCTWHGLRLGGAEQPGWRQRPSYDDGTLVWVQLPTDGETPAAAPSLATRPDPSGTIAAVITRFGSCEPRDIIANRLDPWHGAWFHPYAFSHLTVDESASSDDRLVLEVAYRVAGAWAVPVVADFTCPDARTIVMTIVDGEGAGSVVETHATPLTYGDAGHPARTAMIEATFAHSPRPGFQVARRLAPLVQAGMRQAAARLWVDDLAYAERLYELRVSSRQ